MRLFVLNHVLRVQSLVRILALHPGRGHVGLLAGGWLPGSDDPPDPEMPIRPMMRTLILILVS